jgi:hypothetical protein
MTSADQNPPTPLDPDAERRVKRWTAGIIAAVVAVAFLLVWRSGDSEPTTEDLRSDAARACQEDFIPARLKAPATAAFSSVTTTTAGATYTVTGSVDSENSFGAKIRSSFTCAMHLAGDRWVLESANVSS